MEMPDVAIIHFSGEMKLWDRDHLGTEGQAVYDDKFAEQVLCSNQPWNTRLWLPLVIIRNHGNPCPSPSRQVELRTRFVRNFAYNKGH